MSLKASRIPSKIDDIWGILAVLHDDFGVPDWDCCPWWHFAWSAHALRELCLKFGRNPMSLKASRTPSKMDDILRIFAWVGDDFDVPDWGCCPWWRFAWSAHALMELCLKFGWNPISLKASRTPSKIDDIFRILAGVDDDFDVPDWGWCPWWHYGLSPNALRVLCLKFGGILLSLKASRTLSKIDDISRILAGVDDDFDVPDWGWCPWWHYDIMKMPWGSYV